MRLERPARRKPIGITSLIDVIFLLLLFFMLASSFSHYRALPIASNSAGAGSGARPILLRLHGSQEWDLNGVALDPAETTARVEVLLGNSGMRPVAILAQGEATSSDVVEAMTMVRATGAPAVLITGR